VVTLTPLTRIAEVRARFREEVARTRPVRVSGVVTWRAAGGDQLTVQDETAGIWIAIVRAQKLGASSAGDSASPKTV
jgi:hypothetical protein